MGTQEECKVQHHRTQKERSVYPALQTKGKSKHFSTCVRETLWAERERSRNARYNATECRRNAGCAWKTLRAEMERSRNAGRNADGTQGANTSNYKNTTGGKGTQQERRAESCYMMRSSARKKYTKNKKYWKSQRNLRKTCKAVQKTCNIKMQKHTTGGNGMKEERSCGSATHNGWNWTTINKK